MTTVTTRTQVVVIGAGPAGLSTANLLRQRGVDCVVLEARSREFIERHPRAGFLEEWAVRELERYGLAGRLLRQAGRHGSFEFRFDARRHHIHYAQLTGQHHFVYPQQELVTDLVAHYADVLGGDIRFEVDDVRLHDLTTDRPFVTYTDPDTGRLHRVECAYIAGCDGARGVCRRHIPAQESVFASRDYGIGWLALLVEAPPSAEGVVFGIHPRGFAAHMARTPRITRFYLQCPSGDDAANWSHERVWRELHTRLAVPGAPITEGRIVERQVLDMHNYVVEPMSYGRLHLAGDSAHLVAPIGAKGMNLALHDAFALSSALTARLRDGDGAGLAGYSARCLRRVWQYQEFSQWFADVLHGATDPDPFQARIAEARLRRLLDSPAAATAFCELYIGRLAR
ncbi:4-hydroxybenzoate 3-monooxygenase [Streptomyces silvisoli]|uniref:4-hydroxybenzoate 3-monooxygenase n=1 Tax=Streptomyces silvisoli TaxID=3034235 RepID=A0ABT5ZMZ5_9ACTN|nr:4-hydroxybenzoate 3-monooxygenase [Streptomyces silvisoli]MDF3291198.1 4-hydroxybenzoate 3-monooxygenase [Streptomyces silvisoli]